jgi:hypothetical protein
MALEGMESTDAGTASLLSSETIEAAVGLVQSGAVLAAAESVIGELQ